ncbi:unnamed protein product [Soboliphyme baturini]|uniref:Ovule protein n=1 Tax=Soboliphyme baturini TaxID=241478 RepID=A0A183IVF3_9BILA|nr:unnamed protein product [Soboliphyme baturini]
MDLEFRSSFIVSDSSIVEESSFSYYLQPLPTKRKPEICPRVSQIDTVEGYCSSASDKSGDGSDEENNSADLFDSFTNSSSSVFEKESVKNCGDSETSGTKELFKHK